MSHNHTTITIPEQLRRRARLAGINISLTARVALEKKLEVLENLEGGHP